MIAPQLDGNYFCASHRVINIALDLPETLVRDLGSLKQIINILAKLLGIFDPEVELDAAYALKPLDEG